MVEFFIAGYPYFHFFLLVWHTDAESMQMVIKPAHCVLYCDM